MTGLWAFLDAHWGWFVFAAFAGGAKWVADRFDAGLAALGRRRAGAVRHREELRRLELEAKRRALEAAHPGPVKPVCGCGHDLAFHNRETDACHHAESGERCECQRYTGPEPWVQVYAPPLIP